MITGPEPEYTYGPDTYAEEQIDAYHAEREAAWQQEANEQLQWELEQALREALTKGVSMKSMQILCHGTGVSYARVVG